MWRLAEGQKKEGDAMNALQALKSELAKIQHAQHFLVDDDGIVKPYARYEYQQLSRKAAEIRRGMELLQSIAEDKQKSVR